MICNNTSSFLTNMSPEPRWPSSVLWSADFVSFFASLYKVREGFSFVGFRCGAGALQCNIVYASAG
uniref:Tubulin beta chain n=1 Tax=Parascaris univalens TaxID=6257 RepID=A0A915A1C1_PARUN